MAIKNYLFQKVLPDISGYLPTSYTQTYGEIPTTIISCEESFFTDSLQEIMTWQGWVYVSETDNTSSPGDGIIYRPAQKISTTGNGLVIIDSIALGIDLQWCLQANVYGKETGNSESVSLKFNQLVGRGSSGNASFNGSTIEREIDQKTTGAASWNSWFDVSGTWTRLFVQGATSVDIDWTVYFNYMILG